ncbi:calcium-binding mitochondrial carrier protein Aralar1 [Daktulosphaira vitifoliae]|uniref:calcium-binding mitochondrial carrier protein Aralar1 n=1 Tax=Daktulosphaira vitifoliae TaxID=58002 RepID=UPI0021AA37FA|nr:calcium-binding mitochondrial carrier protein Aralar1 [Daktulosphaira vitifoliae]
MVNGVFDFTWKFWPKTAYCQEAHNGLPKRATTEQLLDIFNKYATVEKQEEKFINAVDFIKNYIGILNEPSSDIDSLKLLSGIVDTTKDGLISFAEFQAFESLLSEPDALYKVAFQLFDINGNGVISYDEFVAVVKKTELYLKMPFNLDSQFMKLYFGEKKNRLINYSEFAQFLHDFHEECGTEIFRIYDKGGTGYISANDFQDIMILSKSHLLTNSVQNNLLAAAGGGQGAHRVSFPYFMAFVSLLNNMELVKRIYLNASNESRTREVTKDEFLYSAQVMSQITPLEVDILFTLCHLLYQRSGKIIYNDLKSITPEPYYKEIHNRRIAEIHTVSSPSDRGVFIQVLENVYRFTLGSISGAIGATAVYPIDLVKTRMQNQRAGSFIGELMYRNSFDCFKKVIRHEGVFGLYRGLLPQLIGVAPEKAIKLTVNDLVKDKFRKENGDLTVSAEVLAGACGGFSQVVFTNPLEIVKIRLQVAGEIASTKKLSALNVIKELGFFGLYKGAKACFLRDVPFSAIYFPAYNHVKQSFADENGYNHPLSLLAAGCIAGVPAASLVTPADVIKTRLQVVAREGQTTYNGLVDCALKIYKEEGPRAFWKGTAARVCRSSPQFGVTLLSYEILQRLFYVDFGGSRPSGSKQLVTMHSAADGTVPSNPDHVGGYHAVLPILEGIESKFGLVFPKNKPVN